MLAIAPYMSIKDETRIRMNLKLKREFKIDDLKNMLKDHISKEAKIKLDKLLKNSTNPKSDFLKALEKGLE